MPETDSTNDPIDALFFDLDGTLVDTTYLHALAWWLVLRDVSDTPMSSIHPLIGMGGSEVLTTLIGHDDETLRKAQGERFAEFHPLVRALPGAREMLRAVKSDGAGVIVVTSAKDGDLPVLLGALDCEDIIDAVISEGDGKAKPAPDLYETALQRCKLEAGRVLAVGDSVWDMKAAAKAGISGVAVTTGGIAANDLTEAGALVVYGGGQDLLHAWRHSELKDVFVARRR